MGLSHPARPSQEALEEKVWWCNQQVLQLSPPLLDKQAQKRCRLPRGHWTVKTLEEKLCLALPRLLPLQDRPSFEASAQAHLPHGRVEGTPDGAQRPAGRMPRGLLKAGVPAEALSTDMVGAQVGPQAGSQREAQGGHPGRGHRCCCCFCCCCSRKLCKRRQGWGEGRGSPGRGRGLPEHFPRTHCGRTCC